MYTYVEFGVTVHSEVLLPLQTSESFEAPDPSKILEIHLCDDDLRNQLPDTMKISGDLRAYGSGTNDQLLICVGNSAQLLLRRTPSVGMTISETSAENIALALGIGFSSCLAEMGYVPLHASCISRGGHQICFAGKSGIGKSTIAYSSTRSGAHFLSDDVTVLKNCDDRWDIQPSNRNRFKLDRKSITAIDGEISKTAIPTLLDNKYEVTPTKRQVESTRFGSQELSVIVFLCPTESGPSTPCKFEQLNLSSGLTHLLRSLHGWNAYSPTVQKSVANSLLSIAKHCKLVRMEYARDIENLPMLTQMLHEFLGLTD